MKPHQYTPDCELCRRDFPNGKGWMVGHEVLHVSPAGPIVEEAEYMLIQDSEIGDLEDLDESEI